MVDIAAQGVSWSGTPRAASPQYIQSVINANGTGTTYVLGSGYHRGQEITLKSGDRLLLAAGAILTGTEDIGTSGWTDNGDGTWSKAAVTGQRTLSNLTGGIGGADHTRGEKVILDGDMMAYRTSTADVDAWHAYANGSSIMIGRNPGSLSLIEVIRTDYIGGAGVELGGQTTDERNPIYGYVGAELANGGDERGAIRLTGTNPYIHDANIYAMAGTGIACEDGTLLRNVTLHQCGQCGIGGGGALIYRLDGITVGEGCHIYRNGIGGYHNDWEGGNSKWAWCDNLTVRGSLWDCPYDSRYTDYGNNPTSAMWFDVASDGNVVHSSVFKGEPGVDWRGGIFYEITYSGKIHDNIFYDSGDGAESGFWQGGCVSDASGAFPGSTIFDDVEVYNNLFYKTAGGWNIISSGAHDGDSGPLGVYRAQYTNNHDNTLYLVDGSSYLEFVGTHDGTTSYPPRFNEWDDNIYIVASALNRYSDEDDGGAGGNLSFAGWQSASRDTGPRAQQLVGSGYDPDPFNGGAM